MKKIHLYVRGRTTKCGRDPGTVATTASSKKVTCGQCLEPNRPFTGGYYRRPQ